MRIRRRGAAGWTFTRPRAPELGLDSTGASPPDRTGLHRLRVQRAGVTLDIFAVLFFHEKLA